jgi:hypothetical protein
MSFSWENPLRGYLGYLGKTNPIEYNLYVGYLFSATILNKWYI